MKLYALTESERASKGQGGNREIVISLTVGNKDRREIGKLRLTAVEGQYELIFIDTELPIEQRREVGIFPIKSGSLETKGEKQKGETLHDDRDYNINPCHCGQIDCPSNQ